MIVAMFSLCWFASDFSCGVVHGNVDKGIDGVDNEGDHAKVMLQLVENTDRISF